MNLACEKTRCTVPRRGSGTSRHWMNLLCAMPLILGAAMILYALSRPAPLASAPTPAPVSAVALPAPEATGAQGSTAREKLVGRWLRPDGGYVLEIRSVGADGQAQAGYFNPRPIHVAKAQVQGTGNESALYVELRDTGYPGNNYRLVYEAEGDRLVGTYHQPAAQQQFNIYFERLK